MTINLNLKSAALTFMILMSPDLFAAVEDTAIDQADTARAINAVEIKPTGTWLPVPIPVSNPTIGSGLQAALLYLHPKKAEDSEIPNATSGLIGMYTNTDSWVAGAFHDGNLKNDLYRFRLLAGTGEFNLDYFGIGSDSILQNNPIKYNLASDILYTQLLRRFPGATDWYFGFRYMQTISSVTFGSSSSFPNIPPISTNMTTSSIGIMTTYDSRDNNYYPTTGTNFELIHMRDKEDWGSDFDFDKSELYYNHYFSLSVKNVLAVRLAFAHAKGDTPFYLLPNLKMRGFPNGRYKNENSLSGHAEWRHKLASRWGFIMFYESGSTAATSSDLFDEQTINSYGGGIRWQVTEDKKLNLGIDVGYSDDDRAVYVQVGEKF